MRGRYTSGLVSRLFHRYRKFNFIVCHTDHKTEFKGRNGHIHHEVNVGFGKTVGYVPKFESIILSDQGRNDLFLGSKFTGSKKELFIVMEMVVI